MLASIITFLLLRSDLKQTIEFSSLKLPNKILKIFFVQNLYWQLSGCVCDRGTRMMYVVCVNKNNYVSINLLYAPQYSFSVKVSSLIVFFFFSSSSSSAIQIILKKHNYKFDFLLHSLLWWYLSLNSFSLLYQSKQTVEIIALKLPYKILQKFMLHKYYNDSYQDGFSIERREWCIL